MFGRAIGRVRRSMLCERTTPVSGAWQAVGWWEARRVPFNLIVGSVGVVSGALVTVVSAGSYFLSNTDVNLPDPPLFAVFAAMLYAIAANVCYTGGWVAELLIRVAWPAQADRFATLTLSLGVLFSVLITAFPGVVAAAVGVFGLLGHVLGVIHP